MPTYPKKQKGEEKMEGDNSNEIIWEKIEYIPSEYSSEIKGVNNISKDKILWMIGLVNGNGS